VSVHGEPEDVYRGGSSDLWTWSEQPDCAKKGMSAINSILKRSALAAQVTLAKRRKTDMRMPWGAHCFRQTSRSSFESKWHRRGVLRRSSDLRGRDVVDGDLAAAAVFLGARVLKHAPTVSEGEAALVRRKSG
jgi:hypothetical protein